MADFFSQYGGTGEQQDFFAQHGGKRDEENIPAPMSQTNTNLLPRIAGDIASGGAQAGYGLLNAPSNIANALSKYGIINPQTAAKVPRTREMSPEEISSFYGVSQPNLADKILQNLAQYAPAGIAGGASLPGQVAAGAAYGATQSQQPIMGAALGAGSNLAIGGAGMLARNLAPALKSVLSKYAASGLTKNIANDMDGIQKLTNTEAFGMAQKNYNNYSLTEKNAWENARQKADMVDRLGYQFNDKPYVDSLSSKLNNLKQESTEQSGFARKNQDAIQLLEGKPNPDPTIPSDQGYIGSNHGTFADAIKHNQALNSDYENEITVGRSLPFNIINYAKANLKDTLNNNISDNSLQNSLGNALNEANKATIKKNTIFNEFTPTKGNTNISDFLKYYKGEGEFKDPSTFINQYIPKGKGEGTQQMEQLSKMLGDDQTAKNLIKLNYFGDTLKTDGLNVKPFIKKFNDLSQDQQDYLFNAEQKNTIDALNKIVDVHPEVAGKSPFLSIWHYSIPALIGGTAGHFMGMPFYEGGLGAALATKLGEHGLSAAFEKPAIQSYFKKYLTTPANKEGISKYLGDVIQRGMQAAGTPAIVSSIPQITDRGQ